MYFFSQSIYCNRCGGTNLYFFKRKTEGRIKILNTCRECINELNRIRKGKGYYKTQKYREYVRQYRQKNKEMVKEQKKRYEAKLNVRIKNIKELIKNNAESIINWDMLKVSVYIDRSLDTLSRLIKKGVLPKPSGRYFNENQMKQIKMYVIKRKYRARNKS